MEEKPKTIDQLFVKVCKQLRNYEKELNQSFIKLSTNFDRFKFIWHMEFVHHELENVFKQTHFEPKEKTKSSEFRREGNDLFKIKRFYDALCKYNSSIKLAPVLSSQSTDDTENDLALAYANRSAVFYHLNEFVLCLNDIEAAITFGYPCKLKSKLIERKLNCLFKLENFAQMSEYLRIEKKSLDPSISKMFENKLSNITNSADKTDLDLNEANFFKSYGNINFELGSASSTIPNASSSITIDYSIQKGLHLKANRDIKVGDLLVYEKPFASVLLGENIEKNCYECMSRLNVLKMNLTFCRQCSQVTYCSQKCEHESWESSHKYECKYFKLLAFNCDLTHMEWLALRIVLKAGKDYLLSIKPNLEDYESKYESINRDLSALFSIDENSPKIYRSDSYMPIFNLITNSRVRKLNDLFRRSFVSLFLVKLLENSGYFVGDNSGSFKENSWFIGGLILRHLQSISCNAHEISELRISESGKNAMANSTAQGIGAGIYAILSMFNHSCDPHVTRNFRGSRCQVRAIQNVKQGEEIFDNYGVIYAVNEFEERQNKLKDQYYFECRCFPCEKNWPTYENIPSDFSQLDIKCLECRKGNSDAKECSKCLNELDFLKLNQLNAQQSLKSLLNFNSSINLSDKSIMNRVENIFDFYCKYLELLTWHKVKRPFQDFNNYEEALKQCLNVINLK